MNTPFPPFYNQPISTNPHDRHAQANEAQPHQPCCGLAKPSQQYESCRSFFQRGGSYLYIASHRTWRKPMRWAVHGDLRCVDVIGSTEPWIM